MPLLVDWPRLKAWYLTHPKDSLETVAKRFAAAPATVFRRASREKWSAEKQQVMVKSSERVRELAPDAIARVRIRKYEVGEKFISHGEERVKDADPVRAVRLGFDLQSEALGDVSSPPSSPTMNVFLDSEESKKLLTKLRSAFDEFYGNAPAPP